MILSISNNTKKHERIFMQTLNIGIFSTLMLAVLAIYAGEFFRDRIKILKTWCLPSAVVGGTIFSIFTAICYSSNILQFAFDYEVINRFFYNVFFAASGLSASLVLLKQGGKLVIIFAILAALLAISQNILALGVGYTMGMNPLVALMAGSTPLTGGHGNSASFAPIAVSMGGEGALEVAIAAATFGLISGCIMGGPLGKKLIAKYGLDKDSIVENNSDKSINEKIKSFVSAKRAHNAVFILLLACGIGEVFFVIFHTLLPKINLPIHLMSMFGGILLRLILDWQIINPQETQAIKEREALYESIQIVGAVCLSLFVSLSIITMKLWELASLALPLITILLLQCVFIYYFIVLITFRCCGKNYDSAIISVGHCGFGLGAVPVSMATMSAVCEKYRYSKIAFFVVPLVGGFISNITNAIIITAFLNIAKSML